MRKDYLLDGSDADESETGFVERHWTAIWEREGGPKGATQKILRREEYRTMRPYLDRLSNGARILDGGCGLGDWALLLAQEGFDVMGMDLSRAVIGQLKERFPDITFVDGDIRSTGLPDAVVDLYFSWGVFEHFEEGLKSCIDEAWRVLKPGGHLFISVPFDNFRHALRGCLASYLRLGPEAGRLRFYQWRLTRRELATELARVGFEVCKIQPIHKRQGVLRSLDLEFGLNHRWKVTRALSAAIAPFVPGGLIAHMLIAVARKPAAADIDRGGWSGSH